jgi:hypothetical protein
MLELKLIRAIRLYLWGSVIDGDFGTVGKITVLVQHHDCDRIVPATA